MVFPDGKYMGEGFYKLTLSEIVGMYIKVEDEDNRKTLQSLVSSFNQVPEATSTEVTTKNEIEKKT